MTTVLSKIEEDRIRWGETRLVMYIDFVEICMHYVHLYMHNISLSNKIIQFLCSLCNYLISHSEKKKLNHYFADTNIVYIPVFVLKVLGVEAKANGKGLVLTTKKNKCKLLSGLS